MTRPYYYFHDCETTGQNEKKHSIIQYYACLTDDKFEIIEEMSKEDILVYPPNGELFLDLNALKYNNFNLLNLISKGVTTDKFISDLDNFIKVIDIKYDILNVVMAGHNVRFDFNFLNELNQKNQNTFGISPKAPLDSSTIAQFLKLQGKLPSNLYISLTNLAKYFNINTEGAHSSKFDTHMTIEVMKELVKL